MTGRECQNSHNINRFILPLFKLSLPISDIRVRGNAGSKTHELVRLQKAKTSANHAPYQYLKIQSKVMNIAILGTGYVGLVSGTCFAEMGAHVTCVDIDVKKINKLKNGIMPIYEPGLEELVKRNVEYRRLQFTTDLIDVLDDVEVVFSAVGTPPDEDGSADLKYVLAVAKQFGQNINKYTILVTKSIVPVGTAKKVKLSYNKN